MVQPLGRAPVDQRRRSSARAGAAGCRSVLHHLPRCISLALAPPGPTCSLGRLQAVERDALDSRPEDAADHLPASIPPSWSRGRTRRWRLQDLERRRAEDRHLVSLATWIDALERPVGGVSVDLDRIHLLADERGGGFGPFAHAVDRHRFDDRVPLPWQPWSSCPSSTTDSGSPGLNRMPTRFTCGTARLISSIRLVCSGSPKPGRVDPGDVAPGGSSRLGARRPAANGSDRMLKTIGQRLDPLDGRLQRLVLQGHDDLGLGVHGRVDQTRQRGQVALGTGDLELVVPALLQVGFAPVRPSERPRSTRSRSSRRRG